MAKSLEIIGKRLDILKEKAGSEAFNRFFRSMHEYSRENKSFKRWYDEEGSFSQLVFNAYLSNSNMSKLPKSELRVVYQFIKKSETSRIGLEPMTP